MSRKITVGAALALALLMVAAAIPLTMMFANRQQDKLIKGLPDMIGSQKALDEIRKKIGDNYYATPVKDAMDAAMVRGYIAGLGDSESRYLSGEEYQTYIDRLEGKTPELGIVLRYSPEEVGLVVSAVKAGSAAQAAGLRRDDHITKAESGGNALSITAVIPPDQGEKAIAKFHEETAVTPETPSVSVTITYRRGGAYQPPVNITLGSAASTISYRSMNINEGNKDAPELYTVGYIQIYQFFKNTADEIEAAVQDLSRRGAVNYIIDVRNCKEGSLDSAERAIDLFARIPKDTAGSLFDVRYKDGTVVPRPVTSKDIMAYMPGAFVVVLIDERTSGVAELFAYELRAFNSHRIFLAGKATKGVRTVQELFPLTQVGGAALLTVGEVAPYGVTFEKDKPVNWTVAPDPIILEGPNKTKQGIIYDIPGSDQQMKGALNILRIESDLANQNS